MERGIAPSLREVLADPKVLRGLTQDPARFRFPRAPLLVVGGVGWSPHVVMAYRPDGSIEVSGAMGNVLRLFAETLNFTYNVIEPEDGTWGSELSNGTWSGMLGQVVNKEADLALGPFGITVRRTKVVDYTASLHYGDRKILSRKGEPEIDSWGFLYPLTVSVWVAVLATLMLAWLVTMVVARRPGNVTPFSWAGKLLLKHLRVFFNQGLTWKAAQGRAGQAVLGSWAVVAAVVFWSYTCTLISQLTVRHISQPIQTLRDLLDDPGVTLYITPNISVTEIISSMKDGELKEMYDLEKIGRLKYNEWLPASEILYGRSATLYTTLTQDMTIATYFKNTKRCDFYKSQEGLFTVNSHCMIGQKNSPLTAALSHKARRMVEAGLYQHWIRREMPATNCRHAPSTITVRAPLSLGNMWGLFVVLGTGLLLAAAVFFLELCVPPKY